MQNLKDEELMLKYQDGEARAMDEILRRYKNPVYHLALRLGLEYAQAQDITQEVFLKLHLAKDTYEPTGKFSTWIFSIAHNTCIDVFRKRKWLGLWPRKQDDSDALVEFSSPDPSPQETVEDKELSALIRECIQGLPFLQKEALILREYENLDYTEIAKILKKSLGTVKTLIHRARQNLKTKLLPLLDEIKGG